MSYLHCHRCRWDQDDFWSWNYNPLRTLLREIKWLAWPRMIETEGRWFSWRWLLRCIHWRVSAPFTQKWWTYKSWRKAIAKNAGKWPTCPKCGHGLCID